MNKKDTKIHRIAYLAGRDGVAQQIWTGLVRVLNRNRRFVLAGSDLKENSIETIRNWGPSVVVGYISTEEKVELARKLNIPVINISGILPHPPFPTVTINNRLTGELAADHLLQKKFTNFAYIGQSKFSYSETRLQAFRNRVELSGHTVDVWNNKISGLGMRNPDLLKKQAERLRDWVKSMPENVGILAADDHVSIAFIESILLVDPSLMDSISLISGHHLGIPFNPSISGVVQRATHWGAQVGELVIRISDQETNIPSLTEIDPSGIVEEETTAGIATDDAEVLHAAHYIQKYVHMGINVKDVVENGLGLGRRALERRFTSVMGHSILEDIQRARMSRAKKLFREGESNLQEISVQSGFTDHKHMQRVFTEREGMTPGAFRKLQNES